MLRPDRLNPEREALSALLRELRQSAGLRQADLAKRLDLPQSFVSKYESGERRLDILEVREICRALDKTLEQFAALLEARLNGA